MNERNNHLPGDLMALRDLEALNRGDLETAAELWEEASHDPALEQRLAEVDETLFTEAAAASRQMRLSPLRRARRALHRRRSLRRPGGLRVVFRMVNARSAADC